MFYALKADPRLTDRVQIEGPTQANAYGFKISPAGPVASVRDANEMTVLSLEVFGSSHIAYRPCGSDALPSSPL